jgi:type I restriction-modification system DNA methylase subunit
MALKKSELYSSLWSSCDELRGGMDASQYKDYVLVLLFIKYVSDNASLRHREWQEQGSVLYACRGEQGDRADPRHPQR